MNSLAPILCPLSFSAFLMLLGLIGSATDDTVDRWGNAICLSMLALLLGAAVLFVGTSFVLFEHVAGLVARG